MSMGASLESPSGKEDEMEDPLDNSFGPKLLAQLFIKQIASTTKRNNLIMFLSYNLLNYISYI